MYKQEEFEEAQNIFGSEWFKKITDEFDAELTQQLKYGDPEDPMYKSYAYEIRGVMKFLGKLKRPILEAQEEERRKKQAEAEEENPRPSRYVTKQKKLLS